MSTCGFSAYTPQTTKTIHSALFTEAFQSFIVSARINRQAFSASNRKEAGRALTIRQEVAKTVECRDALSQNLRRQPR